MAEDLQTVLAKKARRKAAAQGRFKPWTVVSNFAHQSFFYLDRTERWMRVAWELAPFAALVAALPRRATAGAEAAQAAAALVGVHALNWVFNNNFWNCINCAVPSRTNRGAEATVRYLNEVRRRLERHPSITGIMLLGSLSRMQWHARSDIDMRVLRRPGWLSGMCAALLVSRERALAFFSGQPLDVYLADGPEFLERRRRDEVPIFLIKRDARLSAERFPMEAVGALRPERFGPLEPPQAAGP